MSAPHRLAQFPKSSGPPPKQIRKRRKAKQTWIATSESIDSRKNEKAIGKDDNVIKTSKNVNKPSQPKLIDVKKNDKKKKEFKPKQPSKLILHKGKIQENLSKWKTWKKLPRHQKVENMSNKDDKNEAMAERKHKGGLREKMKKTFSSKRNPDESELTRYDRDFLLDLAPDYREVETFVQEQLSNLGIWAHRQRKKSITPSVLVTLRSENERQTGNWAKSGIDEEISLSSLHSLFHSNRTTIKLSFLRKFISEQRNQREKTIQTENSIRRSSTPRAVRTPRSVYVRRDLQGSGQLAGPPHLTVGNDNKNNNEHAAAAAEKGLDYDHEINKDGTNDNDNSVENDGNDTEKANLNSRALTEEPGFELLSPTAKNQHLTVQLADLQKKRQEDLATRQEDMKKLKEQFQNINTRLQDQLRVVVEENTELSNRLNTLKRKNEKLQARLSLIGEKNLELMEELEGLNIGTQIQDDKQSELPQESDEEQPMFSTNTGQVEEHPIGQPDRPIQTDQHSRPMQTKQGERPFPPMDTPQHDLIHGDHEQPFSVVNQTNEEQLLSLQATPQPSPQPTPQFEPTMHPDFLHTSQTPPSIHPQQLERQETQNQMMNFGQMSSLPLQPPHYYYDAPPGGSIPPQLGMSNTPFPGMGNMPFPPMVFPPPFSSYPMLPQLNGDLLPICVTFYGSRHIQNQLENDSEDQRFFSKFFNEVKDRAYEVMTNKFGRFAFEKMLNKCNDDERTILLRNLMPSLATAACDVHGSFGTQVLVKSLNRPEQIKMVADSLKMEILTLITDYKGHYLVIVLIQKFYYEDFKWIDESVASNSHMIATNHQGLQVMKALFKNRTTEQILHLLQIISEQIMELVEDQYGNYIIQTALTKNFDVDGYPHFEKIVQSCKERMLKTMEEHFRHLAQQKFSSNVVELCLKELAFDHWKDVIISELLAHPPVAVKDLINDRYGNYVLQTALAEAHPHQVTLIAERITPHFSCFRVNIRAKWAKLVKAARERTGT